MKFKNTFHIIFTSILFGLFLQSESVIAQDAHEADAIRRMERDKLISQEIVDKSLKEVMNIITKIEFDLKTNYPKLKLKTKESDSNTGVGIRGAVLGQAIWQSTKRQKWQNELDLRIFLNLDEDSAMKQFRTTVDYIASGSVDEIPKLGNGAIFRSSGFDNNSDVSISFVKSRAYVSLSLVSKKRTAKQNEKEVREIAKMIEPLIVVRDSFDH
jgi:hypothetical protein